MILFKVLDIQDDEIMQRKLKRQKTNINGKQKIFTKFIILLCSNSILYFTDEGEIYNNQNNINNEASKSINELFKSKINIDKLQNNIKEEKFIRVFILARV